MAKAVFIAALLCAVAGTVVAQTSTMTPQERFNLCNQTGARLGVWGGLGDAPLASYSDPTTEFRSNIKGSSFYLEGYFGFRIARPLMLELSAGIVNRGDVRAQVDGYVYYGSLLVYPVQLRLKLYPLAGVAAKYQPYIMAGGGVYHGRNSIQYSNDYYAQFVEESRTNINFVAGAGVDYPIAHQIALDVNVNYMPIWFSKGLLEAKSYSAVTVTVGIKYLYTSGKK